MRQRTRLGIQCVLLMAHISAFGQSNPIEGGSTEMVTNQWNVALPWLIVGGNSESNSLIVSDGGQVNNFIGYIGNAVTSTDNNALVTGAGSEWNNTLELSVGYLGAGNALTVADGGTVTTPNAYIGNNSDGNTVIVTGSNSLLDAANLNVGYQGSSNSLLVTDGGTAESEVGAIGYWIGSDNNTATVQSNGTWNSSTELNIGEYGSGNQLVVGAGGLVESPIVNVGVQSISSNNTVTVTGESAWLDAPELYIGGSASGAGAAGNLVEVENGGTVYTESLNIYSDNAFELNDGGRLFINTNFNASMDQFNWNAGGTLEVGGELTGMTNSIEDQRSLVLNGSSAQWDMSLEDIKVGDSTAGNALSIINGALVENQNGYIGYDSGASNNSVHVSGGDDRFNRLNTYWINTESLYLGGRYEGTNWVDGGTGNSLTVEDGGWVLVGDVDTSALVDRVGSQFGVIAVGDASDPVEMVVANDGLVQSDVGFIGFQSDSSSVLVTGSGSVWDNSALAIGFNGGSGNSLTIEDGGRVETDGATIGYEYSSANNSVLVTGNGSVWNSSDIFVGLTGADNNSLTIEDGGHVQIDYDGAIGDYSDNNSVLVTGNNSLWSISDELRIGRRGTGNSMTIEDGGRIENLNGYIGYWLSADSNSVLVTGSGSVWQNHEGLYLGGHYQGNNWADGGTGNSLTVENGGRVLVGDVDTNALADIGSGIIVSDTNGAEMVIASGSVMENESAWIGLGANESGSVLVTGRGSVWDNTGRLNVGYTGSGNSLRIEDGGYVHAQWGSSIGYEESANGNHVVVSGENSVWSSGWGVARLAERQPPMVVLPPIDWPPISVPFPTNYPPIEIWPGLTNVQPVLTNYPANSQPPYVEYVGSGSVLTVGGEVLVGNAFSNNLITIADGGTFSGSTATLDSSGTQLTVIGGGLVGGTDALIGTLTNGLTVAPVNGGSGRRLDTTNVLVQGGTVTGGSGIIVISNEVISITNFPPPPVIAMRLYANTGDLAIGRGGSDNLLEISDGALVANYHGIVGEMSNAWNNAVTVVGTNSEWYNAGDLYLGGRMAQLSYWIDDEWFTPWVDGGLRNSLYVADGGLVSVGNDMHNRNYSTMNLGPGGLISIDGDYYQDATAMLRFGVETNAAGAPVNALITVGGTAEFEENAQIEYASIVGELLFDRFYTNKLIEADALVVAGISNPDSLDLEQLDASGSLVDVIFWENDQDIYALAGRKYLADSAGFDEGSMMGRLSKEIDDMSLLGNSDAMRMIDLLNTMSGSKQNEQLVQEYAYSTPNYLHIQGMTEGLGELTKHTSRRPAAAPEGAGGPHPADQGARGWIRPYGTWSERSAHNGFAGYDHNVYGTLVGIDWIQSNVLIGVAGGYARSNIKQYDGDASEARTGYGVVYASAGTKDWFGDINIAVGRSDVEDVSGTEFGTRADYEASNYALYLGGGKELRSRSDMFSFTPKASLLLSDYYQNAYSEQVTSSVSRDVPAYDRSSIQSSLGAVAAMQKEYSTTILRPEARVRWLHEFNSDVEQMSFTLTDGMGEQFYSLMPAAEEDVLEVGAGLTCSFHDELSLVLDLDWRFGEDYEAYSVSGRAIYEF